MTNAGEYRISGYYGSAWDASGNLLSEVVEVQAPVELGRIDVPLVGTMRTGHKSGRETREGTMTTQKIDSKWELQVYGLLSQSLADRRAARDGKQAKFDPTFTIVLKLDDPEALGFERFALLGCRIWRMPLGFSINDELTQREYPITWESEQPLTAFKVKQGTGDPSAEYVYGSASS